MHTIDMQALAAEIGPDEYVVAATGEIDLETAPRLERLLARLVDEGATVIVLDLRSLAFVDSAALGVVTRVTRDLRAHGGHLVIACDSQDVLAAFRVTGVDRFLTIRPNLTAAIDSVRGRAT
jgi:anti-sigma B factor antagonist